MTQSKDTAVSERSPLLAKSGEANPAAGTVGSASTRTPNAIEDEPPQEDEDLELIQGRKRIKSLLPILGVGIFLSLLDQSVVAAINGEMGSDLHALRNVSWIATAYFLAMTASQPLYGKLSDVFGRKPCLLFAYVAFGIGSLGCGLTNSMAGLIASRAIQGIGGGGMLILVTVLLSDFISLRERGTYQGYLNLFGVVGSTSGGPLGGLLLESIGWRWVFLIQVFLCLVAVVALGLLLRLPQKQTDTPIRRQLLRIDFVGAFLLVLIITCLLFGLNRGSNVAWRDALTISSLCATIPLSLAFLWVENSFAVEPFTPGHVIFDRGLCAVYAQNFLLFAAFTAAIFYLPLLFQVKFEMTPPQAGAGLIPSAISVTIGTVLGGFVLKRTGKFYWLAVVSGTIGIVGFIPLVLAPVMAQGSLASIYTASVVGFMPQGITITASLIAIISNVATGDQAVATACAFLFRSLGAAVGVSTVGVLIQGVLQRKLYASLKPEDADEVLRAITQSLGSIKDLPPSVGAVVRDCYDSGLQAGFGLCVSMLALSTLCTICWREKTLSR